jgi:predicted lipoprotein
MAELIDLGKHHHAVQAEAIKAAMDDERNHHWQTMAVPGLHLPMAFPAAHRWLGSSIEDQLSKVFEEARELADDLADPIKSQDGTWLLELMDLRQSLETLDRILVGQFGVDPLNVARALTIEKNARRGYYLTVDQKPAD